ncbi:MAG: hypothetical protein DMG68_02110 [Acidobacteria bacterium]|nr:MAG: hypothetical protein DMG68_02110 [Acidobacteriota bacterium]
MEMLESFESQIKPIGNPTRGLSGSHRLLPDLKSESASPRFWSGQSRKKSGDERLVFKISAREPSNLGP